MPRHRNAGIIEDARALSDAGLSQRRFAKRLGVSQSCISRQLGSGRAAGSATEGHGSPPTAASLPPAGARLVRRLWRAAEREVALIERAQRKGERAPVAGDLDRQALAAMVRLTRELVQLAPPAPAAGESPRGETGRPDEPSPEEAEELRLSLARKLDGLRDEWLARGCQREEDRAGEPPVAQHAESLESDPNP